MGRVDVAVLEPCEVLRNGLAIMLERLEEVASLECHRSTDELRIACSDEVRPDVIIAGRLPDHGAVDLIRTMFPGGRVLKLIDGAGREELAVAARTRADGYLMLDDVTDATLGTALTDLLRGELPMPRPVADYLLARARSPVLPAQRIQPYYSPREREVVALLLDGLSNGQIAHKLGISLHSAKRHVSAVLHKVNSPSRAHFVAWMLRDD